MTSNGNDQEIPVIAKDAGTNRQLQKTMHVGHATTNVAAVNGWLRSTRILPVQT
ncbi:hypothetical protein [Nocardioides sp.]|uniref:hypothetical protein n=1 Tax=Nocardioides sp. TaxID=35761 RepID=UPI002621223F|nr:hypothetical protein [Nocardioides sp.]